MALANLLPPHLFVAGSPARRPDPMPEDLADVLRVLEGAGWLTARELSARIGKDDRTLREIASRSRGLIISGQRGYMASREATRDEVYRAVAWLRSQASNMNRRADEIWDARYGGF
jgi:hypothetical protein